MSRMQGLFRAWEAARYERRHVFTDTDLHWAPHSSFCKLEATTAHAETKSRNRQIRGSGPEFWGGANFEQRRIFEGAPNFWDGAGFLGGGRIFGVVPNCWDGAEFLERRRIFGGRPNFWRGAEFIPQAKCKCK